MADLIWWFVTVLLFVLQPPTALLAADEVVWEVLNLPATKRSWTVELVCVRTAVPLEALHHRRAHQSHPLYLHTAASLGPHPRDLLKAVEVHPTVSASVATQAPTAAT